MFQDSETLREAAAGRVKSMASRLKSFLDIGWDLNKTLETHGYHPLFIYMIAKREGEKELASKYKKRASMSRYVEPHLYEELKASMEGGSDER